MESGLEQESSALGPTPTARHQSPARRRLAQQLGTCATLALLGKVRGEEEELFQRLCLAISCSCFPHNPAHNASRVSCTSRAHVEPLKTPGFPKHTLLGDH
ncbi:hypothetical protein KVR01_001328 [Diaporthe batatas]|uniref:uncharacterized protein n=1 Tax=Diaporthe batatas TaxID=748121 RepID=UPI001D036247|nr:uncharacterized protein KVR01_001328 [Diaporthe batatas]KAG8168579.1 hypothetical protein KVR01_001328 [Diaporthe batatas]